MTLHRDTGVASRAGTRSECTPDDQLVPLSGIYFSVLRN